MIVVSRQAESVPSGIADKKTHLRGAPQHRNFCVSVRLFPIGEDEMRKTNNPNRQDTLLGGMILGGFVVIAVIAALFTFVAG